MGPRLGGIGLPRVKASETLPRPFNAAAAFVDRNVTEGRGGDPAFLLDDRTLTFTDVQALANRSGNALRELGIEQGDRVLVVCFDAPEFLGAVWGAIKIGAVPVPVSTVMRADDYRHYLNDSAARAAVVSAPLLGEVEPALGSSPHLLGVLVAGGDAGRWISFEERVARASPDLVATATSRDDPAFWLYSSGSTGAPKGVIHRHRDMAVCLERYAKGVLGMSRADRVFSAGKMFHAYGFANSSYFPLGAGAESVLHAPRITPEGAFEVIHRRRPTLFFGVPTLYATMLAVKDAEKRFDVSSLRLCVSAAEALPGEIHTRWRERFGLEILDGIGQTETLHIFLSNRPGESRAGSSGVPVPGYDVELIDEEGRPVATDEIGNLRVRGDSIMAGYWNQPEKTRQTLVAGWLVTGDKYRRDANGFYYYCGRADDMIKVGGLWVSPFEVEATLMQHPSVLEAAVIGREDEQKLAKPKALVILKDPAAASDALAEELKAFVKSRIAPYKYPRWVEFVKDLPKTATGKIQRFKLR